MDFSESFKELVGTSQEVPIVKKTMTSLYEEEWASPVSVQRFVGDKKTVPSLSTLEEAKLPSDIPSETELASLGQQEIINIRKKYASLPGVQNYLAPFEHQANTRETVIKSGEDGILGIPNTGPIASLFTGGALSLMVPAYSESKRNLLVPTSEETSTSLKEEIVRGWEGIGEGFKEVMGITEEKAPQVSEGKIQRPSSTNEDIESIIDKLIFVESSNRHTKGDKLLTSSAGAKGITQVMPHTGKSPGYGVEPLKNSTKEEYIRFAKDYLTAMKDKFGDIEKALAAYNAGPGKVNRAIIRAERKGKDWKEFLPKETQEYIKKVQLEDNTKGIA